MLVDVDVGRFGRMLAAYEQVRTPSGEATVVDGARFSGMLAAQARIVDAGEWTHGPSTLMAVLGLQRAEVANCRVIRWMLDPLSPHGLGAETLRELGTFLKVELDEPAKASVLVEVTGPESRADVVILGPGWTLVIEAKVDAPEGDRQAASLKRDWATAKPLVFLTRSGARPPGTADNPTRWSPISWTWFATTAARLLDETKPKTRAAEQARHALQDWVTTTRINLR